MKFSNRNNTMWKIDDIFLIQVEQRKMPPKAKKKAKPSKSGPLYKFYVSLFKQNPNSKMAIRWLCENGFGYIVINLEGLDIN